MFLHFLQSKEHKEAFLDLAHIVANADGFVNGNEMRYLRSFMTEMGIENGVKPVSAKKELSEIIGGIKDEQVKNIFFAEILLLVFADGDYSDDEKQIVKDMKELFGFSEETYMTFKNWVIRLDKLKVEGIKLILDPSAMK
ncbi:TerB family tellurite resistance protein [Cohnella lupini]|uniref:Tellurite resistance protein TerB n=1 Tax=Cohnella lupini TaxID=1294267 RepID=A0A3D9I4X4_9BACL|nr:TerB family tellurite resistance protein [Cohnella lupini]RED56599.1 tellurite resistance protein TerB [Cohnella lupini]